MAFIHRDPFRYFPKRVPRETETEVMRNDWLNGEAFGAESSDDLSDFLEVNDWLSCHRDSPSECA